MARDEQRASVFTRRCVPLGRKLSSADHMEVEMFGLLEPTTVGDNATTRSSDRNEIEDCLESRQYVRPDRIGVRRTNVSDMSFRCDDEVVFVRGARVPESDDGRRLEYDLDGNASWDEQVAIDVGAPFRQVGRHIHIMSTLQSASDNDKPPTPMIAFRVNVFNLSDHEHFRSLDEGEERSARMERAEACVRIPESGWSAPVRVDVEALWGLLSDRRRDP